MKHLFLDTNVIYDFLIAREPFALHAAILFDYSERKKVKLSISALSINNLYYLLRKDLSHLKAIKILDELMSLCEVVRQDKAIIVEAMASGFNDLEDAIQESCAFAVKKVDLIVTRNPKDFKKSRIPIISPQGAAVLLGFEEK